MTAESKWRRLRDRIEQFERVCGTALREVHARSEARESASDADGRQAAVSGYPRNRIAVGAGEDGSRIEARVLRYTRYRVTRKAKPEIAGGFVREVMPLIQHCRNL